MIKMRNSEKPICAVLVGRATSSQRASEHAAQMQGCPYVAEYKAQNEIILGVFVLPRKKYWWIELPGGEPELLGLESVTVFQTEAINATSPWLQGDVTPELYIAPCETKCSECPLVYVRCEGCPATIFHQPKL
jgi:hypothetical protein